jgi:peptide-methionine (S)-S-oxide reductase
MTKFILGGGCFWCIDAVFRRLRGVTKVESGYAGGSIDSPTYYQVAGGQTGHAEVVRVTFDESIIPADTILDIFFSIHDPTTLNRQGPDVGTQYRSIMLYADNNQEKMFKAAIERAKNIWDDPIVTELKPLEAFFIAEDEHQDYFSKQPDAGYCQIIIKPKVINARARYSKWFKEEDQ